MGLLTSIFADRSEAFQELLCRHLLLARLLDLPEFNESIPGGYLYITLMIRMDAAVGMVMPAELRL